MRRYDCVIAIDTPESLKSPVPRISHTRRRTALTGARTRVAPAAVAFVVNLPLESDLVANICAAPMPVSPPHLLHSVDRRQRSARAAPDHMNAVLPPRMHPRSAKSRAICVAADIIARMQKPAIASRTQMSHSTRISSASIDPMHHILVPAVQHSRRRQPPPPQKAEHEKPWNDSCPS